MADNNILISRDMSIVGDVLREVEIYSFDLTRPSAPGLAHATLWLSPPERERMARYRHGIDQRRYAIGRYLTRRVIAQRTGASPDQIEILIDANGRPYVFGAPSFNIAHSGDHVAVAFSEAGAIGLDIEEVRHPPPEEVMESVFHENETNAYRSASADMGIELFYQLWTRKEAVLKALGEGLKNDPRQFDVSQNHVDIANHRQGRIAIANLRIGDRHKGAIAVHTE